MFIKIFLKFKTAISLEEATEYIFNDPNELQSNFTDFKSKARRLYDISNVLRSLGLIEKSKNLKRKNEFRWLGSKNFSIS